MPKLHDFLALQLLGCNSLSLTSEASNIQHTIGYRSLPNFADQKASDGTSDVQLKAYLGVAEELNCDVAAAALNRPSSASSGTNRAFPHIHCFVVSKEIGSEQIPKSTIAALGKMPGSGGNHDQTAKHRQYLFCCCLLTTWVNILVQDKCS